MADQQNDFWFPAKRYGWGWGPPRRWQGWLVLFIYAALAGAAGIHFTPRNNVAFIVSLVALTGLLLLICWLKGEKPRWRWGNK